MFVHIVVCLQRDRVCLQREGTAFGGRDLPSEGGGLPSKGGGGEVLHPGGLSRRRLGRSLPLDIPGIRSTSGQCASYWNALLF